MYRRLACIVLLGIVAAGCEKKTTPPAPSPGGGGNQGDTITGKERIGWDQQASDATELATFQYAIYVDGSRSEIADVACAAGASAGSFACSGKLPTMSSGAHTLELATFITSAGVLESAKSQALRVTVQALTAGDAGNAVAWESGPAGVTTDGVPLAVERLTGGLIDPVDLAVAPDGRVLVAERTGRVHTVGASGATTGEADVEGGELVSIALDPTFARTHYVYTLYAAPSRNGSAFRLARYREIDGALGERAVLMNGIGLATTPPAASLRATPDRRLLVALGSNGPSSPSSFEGKLLRLEADASTPREQNGTPVIAGGLDQPISAAWDRARSSAWIINRGAQAAVLSSVVILPSQPPRPGVSYRLTGSGVESVAVHSGGRLRGFENSLFLASTAGQHILRLRLPGDARSRQVTTEPLLQGLVGPIRLVAVAGDGTIYFATPDALGRIVPGER
jgi:glucose/arabinose dehydrogenase